MTKYVEINSSGLSPPGYRSFTISLGIPALSPLFVSLQLLLLSSPAIAFVIDSVPDEINRHLDSPCYVSNITYNTMRR